MKSKKFIALCKKYGVDPENVIEVTSFEEACTLTKRDPEKLPIVNHLPKEDRNHLIADYKLTTIAKALRGGNEADYTNDSYKYNSVFVVKANKKKPSGFGLSYFVYDGWASLSGVGLRLCFPNRDTARFFGMHFLPLHVDHHLYT